MKTLKAQRSEADSIHVADRATSVQALDCAAHGPAVQHLGRLGFLAGKIEVPDDFDTMGQDEIERLFGMADE